MREGLHPHPDAVWPSLAERWEHPNHPHQSLCFDHFRCPLCLVGGYGMLWLREHAAKEHFECGACGRFFLYRRARHRCVGGHVTSGLKEF